MHDVAIVGAGPIGIELGIAFKRLGVAALHLDAAQIGHTISWWPRNTEFFSTTERLALAGVPIQTTDQGRLTGEEYLAYLRGLVEQFDLDIRTYERVTDITRVDDGFELVTDTSVGQRQYQARHVVLATGDMDRPNVLGIPGEDLPHVTHYFTDPHRYFRKRLLVVGGKNSAAEAALRCWRAGAHVAVSYRRGAMDQDRVKSHLLPDLEAQFENGSIDFHPNTAPVRIHRDRVVLAPTVNLELQPDGHREVPADFVLLATGFVADMSLFELAGVSLKGERQVPEFHPDTMETNIPGLFVAGTAAAGTQNRYTLFIENTHHHVGKIVEHITGIWPDPLGTVPHRQYELPPEAIQAN